MSITTRSAVDNWSHARFLTFCDTEGHHVTKGSFQCRRCGEWPTPTDINEPLPSTIAPGKGLLAEESGGCEGCTDDCDHGPVCDACSDAAYDEAPGLLETCCDVAEAVSTLGASIGDYRCEVRDYPEDECVCSCRAM